MYLLVEQGDICEPYTCMVLYSNEKDAVKDLKDRAKKIKKEIIEETYEIIEEDKYFYTGTEYSTKYIEVSILSITEGEEICL